MKQFTRFLTSGETICGWCQDEHFEVQAAVGDILLEGNFPASNYYLIDGVPTAKPIQPSSNYDWDTTTHTWIPNIIRAKQQKKLAIEAKREELIYSNILYDGHIFQADEYSVKNIQKKLNEIVAAEALSVPVSPMLWRDFENNNYYWGDLTIYKIWLNGFIIAIANRTTSLIIASFVHKDTVSGLSTLAEVEMYDITTGWE
jgi:hypothetical protein